MSSAARRLRRAQEQELRKLKIKDLERSYDQVVQRQHEQLQREYREARIDQDTKDMTYAMYYLFGIHLHKVFGFGGQRCLRLFQAVDEELGSWRAGEVSVDDLRKKLYDAIGIDVRLDDRTHGREAV